jgi:hypothetical protein
VRSILLDEDTNSVLSTGQKNTTYFDEALALALHTATQAEAAAFQFALKELSVLPEVSACLRTILLEPNPIIRSKLIGEFEIELLRPQYDTPNWDEIRGKVQSVLALENQIGPRLRALTDHIIFMRAEGPALLAKIDPQLHQAVQESPLIALVARDFNAMFTYLKSSLSDSKLKSSPSVAELEARLLGEIRRRQEDPNILRPKSYSDKKWAKEGVQRQQRYMEVQELAQWLQVVRPDIQSESSSLNVAIRAARQRVAGGITLEASLLEPTISGPFAERKPLSVSDEILPGALIDHPQYGRATVMAVTDEGVVIRAFYSDRDFAEHIVRFDSDMIFPAKTADSGSDIKAPPIRNDAERTAMQDLIDAERMSQKLDPFDENNGETGTISVAKAANQTAIGTNSGMANKTMLLAPDERSIFINMMQDLGLDTKTATKDSQFLHHAELSSLFQLRAMLRESGQPMPAVVELFVDRKTCNSCLPNLAIVAAYLGIFELRIYVRNPNKHGNPRIIRAKGK